MVRGGTTGESPVVSSHDRDLARHGLPPRCDLRRQRHQLRPLQRGRRARRAVPLRADPTPRHGHRDAASRSPRSTPTSGTATSRPCSPASATATASTARGTPTKGLRCNPNKLLLDPYAKATSRRDRLGPVAVRLQLRRRGLPQRRRLRGAHDARRGHQPVLRLGGRPPPHHPLQRVLHLRGARQGPHPAAPRRARRSSAGRTPASRTRRSPTTSPSSASPRSS